MPDEPEEGFTVRDRRRFLTELTEDSDATPAVPPVAETPPVVAPARPQTSGPSGGFSSSGSNSGGNAFSGSPLGTLGAGSNPGPDFGAEDFAEEDFGDAELYAGDPEDAAYNSREIPDVYSMLLMFLEQFRGLALIYMGLIASPATGQAVRDLAQAKVAIDTVAFIVNQLEPVVAPEERLPLKALVSDLQISFVEQNKRGN